MDTKEQLIRKCIEQCHVMVDSMPRKLEQRLMIPIWKFLSFVDLANDIHYLIQGARLVSARILFRSVIEIFYDLQLFEKDIKHVDSFLFSYVKDRREKLQDKLDPNKIVFEVDDAERINIREELGVLKREIEKFESEDCRELSPQDKSVILNQPDFHKYIYRQLCRETHCNLGELEQRHYRVSNTGGHSYLYHEEQSEDEFPISQPLLMVTVSCMATFNAILNLNAKHEINGLISNINMVISGEKLRLID